jgi:hypothetical protein
MPDVQEKKNMTLPNQDDSGCCEMAMRQQQQPSTKISLFGVSCNWLLETIAGSLPSQHLTGSKTLIEETH